MSARKRRGWLVAGWLCVGVGLAAGLAVAASTLMPLVRARRDYAVAALSPSADRLRARLERGIDQRARALESRAAEAAGLPELISGLELRADAHTFQDLLETEDWWAPYRGELAISGIVVESGSPIMLGPAIAEGPRGELVRRARDDGAASSIVALQGRAFLLAAARVARHAGRASRAVVVVGAEIDDKALDVMNDEPDVAVGLADGTHVLAAGGATGAPRAVLAALALKRAGSEVARLGPTSRWAGAAWPLEGGLTMLAVLPVPSPPAFGIPMRQAAAVAVGGAALALAGLLLLIMRRRRVALVAVVTAPPVDPDAAFGAQPMDSWQTPFEAAAGMSALGSPSTAALAAPDAAAGPAGAPTTMGRYHLIERIGEGGMAEIFVAAVHGAEGFVRHFVVKRMHPHLAHNRDAINQFIDEARLQSRLVHTNIVPVFDFGMAGGEYFMALEHIRGCDLEHLVRRHKEVFGRALALPVAYYIVHSVLEALAFAHSATDDDGNTMEIVHRDVAPGNVLVSFRGEVKLSDFGIAKAEARVSRTELGMVKGNASYMSPEQARGDDVDARSDLFSAGVVLYYSLTGLLMYGDDEGAVKRLLRAAAGPTTPELIEMDKVPPVAAGVLRRALAADVAHRYQTAREFAQDLAGYFASGRAELAEVLTQLFPEARRPSR